MAPSREPAGDDLGRAVNGALPAAVRAYRWFHRHPELSGGEAETARHLAAELASLGLEVEEGVGGHGVLAVLTGGAGPGPTVLARADMDALPIEEATGLPYASKTPGVMHACGHDLHMATGLGAMRVLAGRRQRLRGTVLFVGQPAEETDRGARAILADPRFRRLLGRIGRPQVALALHSAADLPAGTVSLLPGYAYANTDTVDITVFGRGGHAARPHLACDPIVLGAELVLSLQTIVSRRLPAGERAVVTVGQFRAGHKHNVIPDRATLLITVRSYQEATRLRLLGEIERVAQGVARAHAAPRDPDVLVNEERTPAAYNDPAWTARLEAVFARALGADRVERHEPSLGAEDFGRYSTELGIPGVMWKLGAVEGRRFARAKTPAELPGLHSARFAPAPRPALRTGILTMSLAIEDALG